MISFEKHTLPNGLKVIVHQDKVTPFAAVNVAYNVGSKHENPDRTGFAHLFEHLTFGGSGMYPTSIHRYSRQEVRTTPLLQSISLITISLFRRKISKQHVD